jgi:Neuraminidase (sialidase)
MEPGMVRTRTGRIVVALRNHGADQAIWVCHSDDEGKTWSNPTKTAMIGHPTDLLQLADGRILASYGVRTVHARPAGIRACFSSDNGETWDVAKEVQLRNDFDNWDIGYPDTVQFSDGSLLTAYYYNLLGKYHIGGTFWRPAP